MSADADTVTLPRHEYRRRLAKAWRQGYLDGARASVEKLVNAGQPFRHAMCAGWLDELTYWMHRATHPDEPLDNPPPTLRVTLKELKDL